MNEHTQDWNVHGTYAEQFKDYLRQSQTIDEHIRTVLLAKLEEFDRDVWERARFRDRIETKKPGVETGQQASKPKGAARAKAN